MGEGFGDYLAASFFASRKQNAPRMLPAVMTWDNVEDADDGSARRPFRRSMAS